MSAPFLFAPDSMKKVKKKDSVVPIETIQTQRLGEAEDMSVLRQRINQTVQSAALEMVQTAIASADDGNYVAMKYLFELIGLYPAAASDQPLDGEESRAQVLLQRLGLAENDAEPQDTVK